MVLVGLALSCGTKTGEVVTAGSDSSSTGDGTQGSGSTTEVGATGESTSTSSETTGGASSSTGGPPPTACEQALEALAADVARPGQLCTAVVRLDEESLELLGWQVFCAEDDGDPTLSDADARKLSECCGDSERFTDPADPQLHGHYVGWDAAAVSLVSGRVKGRLFEGTSFLPNPVGEILFPARWRDPTELGPGCDDAVLPFGIGYNPLIFQEEVFVDDGTLALVLGQTALPAAMRSAGAELVRLTFLVYPYGGSPVDPREYILVLDASGS